MTVKDGPPVTPSRLIHGPEKLTTVLTEVISTNNQARSAEAPSLAECEHIRFWRTDGGRRVEGGACGAERIHSSRV
ncbi:hypothetical protein PISMIDRAFT_686528, partial [Pisolithus microcarpus 441]